MKKLLKVEAKTELICVASEVVYLQKPYWCNANVRQLKMSVMKPRHWYDYDQKDKTYPVLMFICGGGFEKLDINAWDAELAYFAKKGYCVVNVEYSALPFTKWPDQIQELKAAVRFLRANAKQLCIDADRIAVMGESAGGYLAAVLAVTGNTREYDVGENLDQSSAVQVAVPWYPVINMAAHQSGKLRVSTQGFIDAAAYVTKDTAPMCLVHGTKDHLVSHAESEYMYEALQKAGVDSELHLIDGADHADSMIVQDEVKERMLNFMDKYIR